jgi:eukaryotic-like serine/threonine-protein kinase
MEGQRDGKRPTVADPPTRKLVAAEASARMGVVPTAPRAWMPGATVGRYLVIEEAGRGGMGLVLRAYDPKLQREVALKTVRTAALSDLDRARILREARAMAQLNHPNVLAVFDVDETETDVVVAMEFVRGSTLRRWMAVERPWREIVRVFIAAGRGLAAAHAVGLLHRDFNPGNVLVGDDGRARVGDFGLARALRTGDSDQGVDSLDGDVEEQGLATPVTVAGIVLGTPPYMAPEQHAALELEAATDQYAFCVSLWEALVGSRPFAGTVEQLVVAKRAGPPSWPGGAPAPRGLGETLRRGMQPSAGHRWPTMDALLDALERHTGGRRSAPWIVGAAIVGTAALWWASQTAEPERCTGARERLAGAWDDERRATVADAVRSTAMPYAESALARVEPALDGYADAWATSYDDACAATTIRGEQSAAVMDLRMGCLRRARQSLVAAVDLLAQADASVVEDAHALVEGLPALDRCSDVDALQAEVAPPLAEEADRVEALRARLADAAALATTGKYAAASVVLDDVEADARALRYTPLRTEILFARGRNLQLSAQYDRSEPVLREALRLALGMRQWNEAHRAATDLVFVVGSGRKRPHEALAFADTATGLAAAMPPDPRADIRLRTNVALTLSVLGRNDEAEQELRAAIEAFRALPDGKLTNLATLRANLAAVLFDLARDDEAEVEARASLELRRRVLGPEHPDVAASHNLVGAVLLGQGRLEEAAAELRAAIAVFERVGSPDHPSLLGSRSNLGLVLLRMRSHEEALAVFRDVLAQQLASDGEDLEVALTQTNMSEALLALDRVDEAIAIAREALVVYGRSVGRDHQESALAHARVGEALSRKGEHDEAIAELRTAVEINERVLTADHPDLLRQRETLAAAERRRAR